MGTICKWLNHEDNVRNLTIATHYTMVDMINLATGFLLLAIHMLRTTSVQGSKDLRQAKRALIYSIDYRMRCENRFTEHYTYPSN